MNKDDNPDLSRMRELVKLLNEASKAYYQGQDEIMTNLEYDTLYDELVDLENATEIVLSTSPTIHVGYETISELPKEAHIAPMLSLDKTKEISDLVDWIGDKSGLLSMKLDGLSIILTYEGGKLTKALTRGNGEIGEVITNNAKTFINIPNRIAYKDTLVVRGEALILYSDFEELNQNTKELSQKYKNPRNLCSGSVRQLNNEITAQRRVRFYCYNIISTSTDLHFQRKEQGLLWLENQGFDIVPYKLVNGNNLSQQITSFSDEVAHSDLPSDGLVLTFDDIAYSSTLGRTAKFPRDSIAFKWQDELADTTLRKIEWSASRTGLINPVAIFDSVELEGTSVSRASVHNISILHELKLGIGDTISVYKANMIIPQIHENKTKSNTCFIPESCPVCGAKTKILKENGSEVLICPNENCYAKQIKLFTHFVSRNALNIDGLSEATIERLINEDMLHDLTDLFDLEKYRQKWILLDGFGEKSFDNLMVALENAKTVPIANFLYGIGIKGIGLSTAKLIVNKFPVSITEMNQLTVEQLSSIDGIGEVLAQAFVDFFSVEKNQRLVEKFNQILHIVYPAKEEHQPLKNLTFVITGSLSHFNNRDECKEQIERLGGKVTGSVSKNTDYLVNNNVNSQSSKNKKAKDLGIPIIDEEELLKLFTRD